MNVRVFSPTCHSRADGGHLQQALQRLHHLLLPQGLQPGLARGPAAFHSTHASFQGHRDALEHGHS